MATLVIRSPDGSTQRVPLSGEVTVGREGGGAEVTVRDRGVSRQHCRLFVGDDGQVWVEDLGSANGSFIDGEQVVEPTVLPEGSELLIGESSVTVAPAARRSASPRRPTTNRPVAPGQALAPRPKRPGGTGRSTRMVAAVEMPPRRGSRPPVRRPSAGASGAAGADGGRPRLKGSTGPYAGQTIELVKGTTIVGRVPPCDLVLEDDSVSRRHAEIYKMGNTVSVRDLGSANGTYVNGERIDEQTIGPGDEIRFGVVEFTYMGPKSAHAGKELDPKKKKLILFGSVGALFVLALLGLALGGGEPPPNTGAYYEEEMNAAAAPEDPLKLLGQCKSYADKDSELNNWEKAVEVCGKVIELDPTLTEALALQRKAKREVEYKGYYEAAKLKISTSQDEAGIELLVKIDKESAFFVRARKEFNDAAERVEKRMFSACMTSMKVGMYTQAYEECKRSAEMVCNTERGISDRLARTLKTLGSRTGRPATIECPKEYAAFQAAAKVAWTGADPVSEIKSMYSDPAIQKVVLDYHSDGRPKQASDTLKRMRSRQKRKYGNSLDELILLFDIIDGKYTAGQAGLLTGDPDRVMEFWSEAFAADAKVMPKDVVSALAKDMSSQLSALYVAKADEEVKKDKIIEAFRFLHEGYKLDKMNTELILRLQQMESWARGQLENGDCESIMNAIGTTLPESTINERAKAAARENGC